MELKAYDEKINKVLISEAEIKNALCRAGKEIDKLYDGNPVLLVSILKGSFVFAADLCRSITVPCEIGFMRASSYCGTASTGQISVSLDLDKDISKYHVVIAEDIVDTGKTLKALTETLKNRKPLSLTVVTLLDKPSRRETDFVPDISLFTIPDLFVIGYGLDYNEYYRNLPYIAEYKE